MNGFAQGSRRLLQLVSGSSHYCRFQGAALGTEELVRIPDHRSFVLCRETLRHGLLHGTKELVA